MDYWKILEELHAERQRIAQAIKVLEGVQAAESPKLVRRGRKSMNAAERQIVSQRMRAYWQRRKDGAGVRLAVN